MIADKNDINDRDYNLIRKLKPRKIILPLIIGIGVVLWFFIKGFRPGTLQQIPFSWSSVFWLIVAVLFVVIRTFGYMARIRVLSGNELTWLQSFRIIMLWEFTSAVTPSTIGGTAFAVIFLHKEGINVGRSTSITLLTSFLDELYFVIMFPLVLFFAGWRSIFITTGEGNGTGIMNNLVVFSLAGYVIIFAWTLAVGYGLFVRPEAIRKMIIRFFSLPWLRRWKASAEKAGDDIVSSSSGLKKMSRSFWWKTTSYTFLTWSARYLVVNAIIAAFFAVSDHFLIFARQLVLWIMMIISPTPGGAGLSEIILAGYMSDLIPVAEAQAGGVSFAIAVIWRIITFYPFLLIGAMILPGWIERKFIRHKEK